MNWTLILGCVVILLFLLHPWMNIKTFQKVIGITLFLEIFYIIGHYVMAWPFPTPIVMGQLFVVSGLGVALGVFFSKIWPLPPLEKGFERIIRTFLLVIPALGFGMGLQILLQGAFATQAIYLIFACAAWLGSGRFVREEKIRMVSNKEVKGCA
ncbi:hypothetical protein JCM21714_1383 [Gracilibacillus boraciitolerans JCM 21714]|uniref:Uncharacterized protein n=1 Tax=Gracilibacillus boraciitolerans JCM 21714 TaxID=1298598 RepID=W4VI02_9BACI|nr:hypothetical protein [Gracilibacillus boraciitolerans]GAE92389.1 hypothetical protein JCM21714_1383 [Gracilibacillus boraciitolerans JCM 21714]